MENNLFHLVALGSKDHFNPERLIIAFRVINTIWGSEGEESREMALILVVNKLTHFRATAGRLCPCYTCMLHTEGYP